jgi:monoamine oxidase
MGPVTRDSSRQPVSWHVARWGDDRFSRGSWSYIRPGGSPADRWNLAEPIGDRFVLCGEAVGTDQPAMTHGAFASGARAANWCLSVAAPGELIAVIGAGFAGIGAARTLVDAGISCVVIEARSRLGGRVHTVDLADVNGGSPVSVDAGAAWLQQYPKNPFADLAHELGVPVVASDFGAPLSATNDGAPVDVKSALARIERAAASATSTDDRSLLAVVKTLDDVDPRALQFAIDADVVLESGAGLEDTSARWFFREEGVGNDDHWLIGGYRTLIDHFARGIDVRLESPVTHIAWNPHGVTIAIESGAEMVADRCICSVPISLIELGTPRLDPGLPSRHREALARIGTGVVEKVLLRFSEHWWPRPPSGYFRWYDTPASWCEWVDLSDGCGAPVVAGLIAHDAVARHHHGRSDEEVALAAAATLARWANSF